jgi:hypothetical protein
LEAAAWGLLGLNTVVAARSKGPDVAGTRPRPPAMDPTGADWDRASPRVYRAGSRGISTLPLDRAVSEKESPRPRPSPESSWEPSEPREAVGEGAAMRDDRNNCRPLSLVKLDPGSEGGGQHTGPHQSPRRVRMEAGRDGQGEGEGGGGTECAKV